MGALEEGCAAYPDALSTDDLAKVLGVSLPGHAIQLPALPARIGADIKFQDGGGRPGLGPEPPGAGGEHTAAPAQVQSGRPDAVPTEIVAQSWIFGAGLVSWVSMGLLRPSAPDPGVPMLTAICTAVGDDPH
jgi:hypothetical protein